MAVRRGWIDEFSGGSVLVIAGGLLLAVAGVAATASQPVLEPQIALAFGALIAVGELVRREPARRPIGGATRRCRRLGIRPARELPHDGRHHRNDV